MSNCFEKYDVGNNNHSIDILSSRALAQLYETLGFNNIDFEKTLSEDIKTKELLMNGDNIGLTFAESPLIRKSFMKIKPKTVDEIAIVYPLFVQQQKILETSKKLKNLIICLCLMMMLLIY